jgi:hypothetical protein
MFDLEQAVADWRKQMLAAGIQTPVPLEELESHFRDDIEKQMREGINAQAAFDAAIKRLGQADALNREFKLERFDIRFLSPNYMRVYCLFSIPLLVSMIWAFASTETSLAQRYLGIAIVSLIAFYTSSLPFIYRRHFIWQNRLMRAVLRFGNWFASLWMAFALLAVILNLQLGNIIGLVGWSMFAAFFATYLACANYEREQINELAAALNE